MIDGWLMKRLDTTGKLAGSSSFSAERLMSDFFLNPLTPSPLCDEHMSIGGSCYEQGFSG
jgi:hypothetical protein